MRKELYSGESRGFWSYEKFGRFLESLGAEAVYIDREYHVLAIAHVPPQNVTLRYETRHQQDKGKVTSTTWIDIFGDEKGIGEVERKILEESRRHRAIQSQNIKRHPVLCFARG